MIETHQETISTQVKQAVILAGGLGTRLRSVVSELPKCMAPVAGRPFLFYVINWLRLHGIEEFIFSLGYKYEVIEKYLQEQFPTLRYQCSIEEEPLGTGGAIAKACTLAKARHLVVANGDTIFKADIRQQYTSHLQSGAACTLALKPMHQFERYGVVDIDETGTITNFREKKYYDHGLINGGIYMLDVERFLSNAFPEKFSFEKDYLEKYYPGGSFRGIVQDSYFIDIGIPEDFSKAQAELKQAEFKYSTIDKSWTLFLDRDGVINHDKVGSYIFSPDEFKFYDDVPDALKMLAGKFGKIIIATNQRGVGRGMMSLQDLHAIHQKMQSGVESAGGRIDEIFYATSIDNDDPLRKPNPGMAVRAKDRFPEIDFSRSVMVGNNISDMQFGRNAGMYTIFLTTTSAGVTLPHPEIDLIFNSLPDFAKAL